MDANEIMQAFDKQYGSAATLPTVALFAGIAIGVIGIIGLIVSLIGKGKTTGIGKFSSVLAPIELILGIISLLAFAGVTTLILLVTNGILEPNELFYGFAFTPAKFGMPIGENGPTDTVVIITYAIVLALPALICIGAAIIGFIGKSKAKKAAANLAAQPQFAVPGMTQQPVPQPAMAQQPAPQTAVAQQPAPQPAMAQQPAPQPAMAQQPAPQPAMAQQPVPQPEMIKKNAQSCPVCGNAIEGNRTFCTACGVKVAFADEEKTSVASEKPVNIDNSTEPVCEDTVVLASVNNNASMPANNTSDRLCPVCGDILDDDSVFCSNCGTPVNNAQPVPEVAPATSEPEVAEPAPAVSEPETPEVKAETPAAPEEDYNNFFDAPEAEVAPTENDSTVVIGAGNSFAPENNANVHFCTVCGNILNENSAFCTKCGTPVNNAQPAPNVAPAVSEPEVAEPAPAVSEPETPEVKAETPAAPEEDYNNFFDAPEAEVAPTENDSTVVIGAGNSFAPENNANVHFCTVCGNILNENSAFCTKCGTPVNNAQPAPDVAPAVSEPEVPAGAHAVPAENYNNYYEASETIPESGEATMVLSPIDSYDDEAEETPNTNGHFCSVCGYALNENSAFCTRCGSPTSGDPVTCPNCGTNLSRGTKFCVKCGTKI